MMEKCTLSQNKSSIWVKSISPLLFLALFILCLDQITKFMSLTYLPSVEAFPYHYPYGGVGVFRNFLGIEFSLVHMTNRGAAWGVFGDYQLFLIIFRIILISALCLYFFRQRTTIHWKFPFIMVIAGAFGNVLDYFLYGHVIDMIHFVLWGYDFPIFNIADTAISLGIGCMMLFSFME